MVSNRYRVERQLDRGGMGVVLRAADLRTGQSVALKVLSPKIARNPTHRARFQREIEVIRQLEHPNLLRCLDVGSFGDSLYIVTELLEGFSMRGLLIREGRLDTHRAAEIVMAVLSGLACAHDADIVHRDLKPDNVFVGDDGSVKLLDFGLAKVISAEDNRLTATGMICGTASYVAPEALVTEQPGKEADVYAVGLIFVEAMIGRQLFASTSTSQTFMQQLVVPARIPKKVWDSPLGPVLIKALQKHPDERFPDAGAMFRALQQVPRFDPILLGNEELPPRPPDDLSGFLLDHLADGRGRTLDTLHRLPKPEPYVPEALVDDKATLQLVIESLTSGELDSLFESARAPVAGGEGDEHPTVQMLLEPSSPEMEPEPARTVGLATVPAAPLPNQGAFIGGVAGQITAENDVAVDFQSGRKVGWIALALAVLAGVAGAVWLWGQRAEPEPEVPPVRPATEPVMVSEIAEVEVPSADETEPEIPSDDEGAEEIGVDSEPHGEPETANDEEDVEPPGEAVDDERRGDELAPESTARPEPVAKSAPARDKGSRKARKQAPEKKEATEAADNLVDKYVPSF